MQALLEYWDWLVVDEGLRIPFSKYPKSHPLGGGGEECWKRKPGTGWDGSLARISGSSQKRNSFLHPYKNIHLLHLYISFFMKDPPCITREPSIWNLKQA